MKKLSLLVIAIIISSHIIIGQNLYDVKNIADSLKVNANAVIRFYSTSYKMISAEKYTVEVNYVVTVLNENGRNASELNIYYDRNSSVSNIKGYLYNKYGVLRDKLKKKEISDYALQNSSTLFSDNRIKHFMPAISSYPYTIEYKYTVEHTGIVAFNTWLPQKGFNISAEMAELSFITPNENDIKYKVLNYDFSNNSTVIKGNRHYKWTVRGLEAIKYEPNAPSLLEFMPAVLLSPNIIRYEKTVGDFSSWKSYGKWVYNLINERDILSKETIDFISKLTDTIPDKKTKAKAIYKYMQSRTRYVNIALGLGGFQPIKAADVDEKGYGDCKALTNYTKALLKCAGIRSYYTEIGTGSSQEIKFIDFASANQTNHVILCVPLNNDTVWLECTNQKIPFGFIGIDSQNRYALLIKPGGGELVKTPSLGATLNTRISNINLIINEQGDADFNIKTQFNNNLYSEILELMNYSESEQKRVLLKTLSLLNTITLESVLIEDNSETTAKGELNVKGIIKNYASKTGTRMFVLPVFFHEDQYIDLIRNERKLPIFEPLDYTYIDTLTIELPENHMLEHLLESQQISCPYGRYIFDVEYSEESIIIIRKIEIFKGQYNNEIFDEINKFLKGINNCENGKIILKLT